MAKVTLNKQEKEWLEQEETRNLALESMLKRFKRQVTQSDILYEVKKRQYFLNKREKREEKDKRAKIRALKTKRKNRKKY